MRIVWDESAVIRINETANYIEQQFGVDTSIRFLEEVQSEADSLLAQPRRGQPELILSGSKFEFRRLVIGKLNKMIYFVNGETIEIVDFWAARMDLKTLAKNLLKRL